MVGLKPHSLGLALDLVAFTKWYNNNNGILERALTWEAA